jgi:hypothetical protein
MAAEQTISILRRLLDPEKGSLSPAAAEAVLQFSFPESDKLRIIELGSKRDVGTLTAAEEVEYDAYIAAADLLSLWKAKARLSLKHQPSAA